MSECGGHRRRALLVTPLAVLCCVLPTNRMFGSTQQVDLATFRAQVSAAEQLAGTCAANAAGCDADAVPPDADVTGGPAGPSFHANWEWLREALRAAKKGPPAKRVEAMQAARDHLAEEGAEATSPSSGATAGASFRQARQTANSILAGPEFQAAEGPSWWDRLIARFEDWLGRAFRGMQGVGARNPWIAPVIEWALFGAAAAGLILFVRRSLARQSLRIALSDAAAAVRRSHRDTTDWARMAEERAAAGDWREAVHSLYWAAIVSLEARNAWKPNPTRTPREYPRLLRPGSQAQRHLRDLTGQFERVWYGNHGLDEADFRAAQASFAAIRAADLRASGMSGGEPVTRAAPAGAG